MKYEIYMYMYADVLYCRESSKPINVLTGLDYWLDNLMCNVPELAMCYHVDGIVQVLVASSDMFLLQVCSTCIHTCAHTCTCTCTCTY